MTNDRKGVIWNYWSDEERQEFIQAVKQHYTPVIITDKDNYEDGLIHIDIHTGEPDYKYTNMAWWILEWDQMENDKLIGKLCIVKQKGEDYEDIGIVISYNKYKENKFEVNLSPISGLYDRFAYAKPIYVEDFNIPHKYNRFGVVYNLWTDEEKARFKRAVLNHYTVVVWDGVWNKIHNLLDDRGEVITFYADKALWINEWKEVNIP